MANIPERLCNGRQADSGTEPRWQKRGQQEILYGQHMIRSYIFLSYCLLSDPHKFKPQSPEQPKSLYAPITARLIAAG